jgi:hypothetical protein
VTLTVTPSVNLSVNISSTTGDFGNVSLGASKTICIGDVINDGNGSAQWEKAASDTGNWTLTTVTAEGANQFRLLVITTLPATVVLLTGASQDVACIQGNHGVLGTGVNANWTALTEGDGTTAAVHAVSTTRRLWVSIMMPTSSSVGTQQTMSLSIRAKLPS